MTQVITNADYIIEYVNSKGKHQTLRTSGSKLEGEFMWLSQCTKATIKRVYLAERNEQGVIKSHKVRSTFGQRKSF